MSQITPSTERPEKPRSRLRLWTVLAVVVVLAVAAAIVVPNLTARSADADAASGRTTVRLGVNDIGKEYWDVLVAKAADEGIDVELVSFTDYNTPNPALSAGDIDINAFQHVRYLAQYDASQDEDLVPLGATAIYPIGFYSTRWKSVEEVPQGAEVTLSNNPANQVRPLLALYNAGLVEFTKEADWSVTLDDVDYDRSRIGKITPIDPTQTAASLDSVDIAFVDGTFAENAGLTDAQQIYNEDVDRPDLAQYINIFAVRGEDRDDPALQKIVELYHSDEVVAALEADPGFDGVIKDETADELQAVLEEQLEEFE